MSQVRFRADTTNSFFGNFLYETVVPKTHFLYRLRHEIPWGTITAPLIGAYKGGAEYGPTPYHPEKLLRMLLVAYLFGISERRCEAMVNDTLSAKYFVGLGVDELPPDHSTLTVFKQRIMEQKGVGIWEKLFTKTIRIAKKKGITFGTLQLIDSTHTTANVNQDKDRDRQATGQLPRDRQASYKIKGAKTATTKSGQRITITDRIYGYKSHTSMNQANKLITNIKVTTARRDDGKQFICLVKKDQRSGVTQATTDIAKTNTAYGADKGYDQGDNHYYLKVHHLYNAISLKKTRIQPLWLKMRVDPYYQHLTKLRGQIEAKFGEEKLHHRFSRCRYLGLSNYKIQAYITAMVVNLKRILSLTNPISPPLAPALYLSA